MSDDFLVLDASLSQTIRAAARNKVVRPSTEHRQHHQWGPVEVAQLLGGNSYFLNAPDTGKTAGRSNFAWGFTESAGAEKLTVAILKQLGLEGSTAEPFAPALERYITTGLPRHADWEIPLEAVGEVIAGVMDSVDRSKGQVRQLADLENRAAVIDFDAAVKAKQVELQSRPRYLNVEQVMQAATWNRQDAAMRILQAVGREAGVRGTPSALQSYYDGLEGADRRLGQTKGRALRFGATSGELDAAMSDNFEAKGDAYLRGYEVFAREVSPLVNDLESHWSMRGGTKVGVIRGFFRERLTNQLVEQARTKIDEALSHDRSIREHGLELGAAAEDAIADFRNALERGAPDGQVVRPIHSQMTRKLDKQRTLREVAIASREADSAFEKVQGMERAWEKVAADPERSMDFDLAGVSNSQTPADLSKQVDLVASTGPAEQTVALNRSVNHSVGYGL